VIAKTIDVVIPVFNNETSLEELHSEIQTVFERQKSIKGSLLFVDDGSTDGSWNKILKICDDSSQAAQGVRLTRNYGQLAAMYAGYGKSKANAVISISADLQDPPRLISELIDFWEKGHDLVAARRNSREDDFWSKLTSRLAYKFLRTDIKSLPHGGFDYFLMDETVRNRILRQKGRHRFLQGEVLLASKNPKYIGYTRLKRKYGKSGYNFKKRLSNFLDASTDSSYGLIRKVTNLGFSLVVLSAILISIIAFGAFMGKSPFEGFLLLSTAILSLGAIQIFLSGVILEYMWRIYDISRNKSFYEIGDETNPNS
jgi:glycosyltransferase involved in cell wall biosynthesis